MAAVEIAALSFDYDGAAAATGLSTDVLRRAVRAGDLTVVYPLVDGRPIAKPVITADEIRRWLDASATEGDRRAS